MASMQRVIVSLAMLLMTGCTQPGFQQLLDSAHSMAEHAGFTSAYIDAGPFTLMSFSKLGKNPQQLTVYIEGDGRAWINRRRVSLNPTPVHPLALQLATRDQHSDAIIYLARPCQFRPTWQDKACDPLYWTLDRYSELVVNSLNTAVDKFKAQHQFDSVVLAGHSGGGALAVLMAARRNDVAAITTVAANLDIEAFSRLHQVSPLTGSLNPVDDAARLRNVPQQHFFGKEDKVVPLSSVQRYREQLNGSRCARFVDIDKATHQQGWLELWPQITVAAIAC